jgi:hypothetical protein
MTPYRRSSSPGAGGAQTHAGESRTSLVSGRKDRGLPYACQLGALIVDGSPRLVCSHIPGMQPYSVNESSNS